MKRFPPLLGVRVAAAERLSTTLRVVRSGDEERGGEGGRSVAVGSSLFLSSVGNSGCSRVGWASSFAVGKNKEVKEPSFEGACDTFFSSSLSLLLCVLLSSRICSCSGSKLSREVVALDTSSL